MATSAIQMSIMRRLKSYEFPEDEPEYKNDGRCAKCCDKLIAGGIELWETIERFSFTRLIFCALMYATVGDFISDIATIIVFLENAQRVFAIISILCLYASSRFGVYRYARKTGRFGFSHIPRMILSINRILLAMIPFVSPLVETDLSLKFNVAHRKLRRSSEVSRSKHPVSCWELLWLVSYCIWVETLCLVGSFCYGFLVFWEITRLIPIYYHGLGRGYQRPPEFIVIALVDALEAFPQLIIQIIAFNQDTSSMDRTVFHVSVIFSTLGLLKAIITFAWHYKPLVAGIEDTDSMSAQGRMTINRGTFYGKSETDVNICPYIQGDVCKVKTLNLAESQNLEIDSITTLPNLTKLQLINCGLLTFGTSVWAERFPKLTELDCRSNSDLTANPFPYLPKLKKLCLRDTGVSLLPLFLGNQVPNLEELDLSENTKLEIEALPPLPSLKKLTIQKHHHVRMSNSSIKQNRRRNFIVPRDWGHCFFGLRTLILDENAVDVDSIPEFQILTMLSLKDCKLHNLGSNSQSLRWRLPSLKALYLSENPIDIQHLTTLPLLEELALDYTDQTSVDLNPKTWLSMFPDLSTLGLSGNVRLCDLSQLNDSIKNGKLEVLRLGCTGDETGSTLAKDVVDVVDIR